MEVSTSILSKDDKFQTIDKLNNSTTDYIHFDVMDGKFVSNEFIKISEIDSITKSCKKKIDIHLMVENPKNYIKAFMIYNPSYITIHYEIENCEKYINMMNELGLNSAISIKPKTDIEKIYHLLDKIKMVLIMSVEPGKSGQTFIPNTKNKIKKLKEEIKRRNLNVKIEVDGGICEEVFDKIKDADILVSASYILSDLNNIEKLKQLS